MTKLLIGDIGGTKTLLRLVAIAADQTNPADPRDQISQTSTNLYEQRFASGKYADFSDLLQEFLRNANQHLGSTPVIARACFGIAGPIQSYPSHQTCQFTNLGWYLDSDRLSQTINAPVDLINDFVAAGYGVLGLPTADLHTLQAGIPQARSPIAVIGAGTGLGQAFLAWQGDRYAVYATEGGHTDFAPRNDREMALWQYLRQHHERISVERIVSGTGIVAIYQFLRDTQNLPENPEIAARVRQWESGSSDSEAAAAIANAAMAENASQRDRLAVETMQIFCAAYAAEIGNLALKIMPNGGLYIAGGIAAKILPLLQNSQLDGDRSFLEIIKSKGRVSAVFDNMPIHIVLNPEVGLIGAMLYAIGNYGDSR